MIVTWIHFSPQIMSSFIFIMNNVSCSSGAYAAEDGLELLIYFVFCFCLVCFMVVFVICFFQTEDDLELLIL